MLAIAICEGSGYARTTRLGPGRNPVCGSKILQTCRARAAILVCESVTEPVEDPYLCR